MDKEGGGGDFVFQIGAEIPPPPTFFCAMQGWPWVGS